MQQQPPLENRRFFRVSQVEKVINDFSTDSRQAKRRQRGAGTMSQDLAVQSTLPRRVRDRLASRGACRVERRRSRR